MHLRYLYVILVPALYAKIMVIVMSLRALPCAIALTSGMVIFVKDPSTKIIPASIIAAIMVFAIWMTMPYRIAPVLVNGTEMPVIYRLLVWANVVFAELVVS